MEAGQVEEGGVAVVAAVEGQPVRHLALLAAAVLPVEVQTIQFWLDSRDKLSSICRRVDQERFSRHSRHACDTK